MTPQERKRARRLGQYRFIQSENERERSRTIPNGAAKPIRPDTKHPQYDAACDAWQRARDVLAGEDAVKEAATRYLPMLEHQSPQEYAAYKKRASFFNATARTAEGYLGLIFRRPPFLKVPKSRNQAPTAMQKTFAKIVSDVDLVGTPLNSFAKSLVLEVISVGRAGTLLDYSVPEGRPFFTLYKTEQILNWRSERVNGRTVPTMIALSERVETKASSLWGEDRFETGEQHQIRVLKLVDAACLDELLGKEAHSEAETMSAGDPANVEPPKKASLRPSGKMACLVDVWQPVNEEVEHGKQEIIWVKVSSLVPKRFGQPLPFLPFVFHGPRHSHPDVDKLPLADIIAINLDHYRLDADYKHGMHFTALPTAWVSGFHEGAELKIGSSVAWVTENVGASAGYLEFTGQGLTTFERAMDRDEKLLAVLGSRLLEGQKKVGEAAQAIELRQSGENSILSSLAQSVSQSLSQVLRVVYWWQSTENTPDEVGEDKVLIELNTDFSTKGMDPQEIQAVVAAWQAGAISRDTMTDLFRRGEILPEGRSVEEEIQAIGTPKTSQQVP